MSQALHAHAFPSLSHGARPRSGRRAPWTSALAAALLACSGGSALAEAPAPGAEPAPRANLASDDTYVVNDADPESKVPTVDQANANPLQFGYFLMDLAEHAELAVKRGNFDHAAAYYRAMAKAVPERSVSFQKQCEMYERGGHMDEAITACRTALDREGVTARDFERYVQLVLAHKLPLSAELRTDLTSVFAHLDQDANAKLLVTRLRCRTAAATRDVDQLAECAPVLLASAPELPESHVFGFLHALLSGNVEAAEKEVALARKAGLDAAAADKLQQRVDAARADASSARWSGLGRYGLAAAALAALLALFVAARGQRRTQQA